MPEFTIPVQLKQDLDTNYKVETQNRIVAEYEFDNQKQAKPMTIYQLAEPVEKIQLKINYLNTVCGLLRIIIIVNLFSNNQLIKFDSF